MKDLLYIGLDFHKESISIAVAEPGRKGEIRSFGKIINNVQTMEKAIARLRKQYGAETELHFCYEAGPCGFVLVRRLVQLGHQCIMVAPSKIPRQSGDEIKTDRRDAEKLAPAHRAGDLKAILHPGSQRRTFRNDHLDRASCLLSGARTTAAGSHRSTFAQNPNFAASISIFIGPCLGL